ncbi:MAG: hypothetical protein HY678_00845 [Chloroflexi bacterium]|nr:hypothetical protein [Chloroflexota bacterium]
MCARVAGRFRSAVRYTLAMPASAHVRWLEVLDGLGGNVSAAARQLGIARSTLIRWRNRRDLGGGWCHDCAKPFDTWPDAVLHSLDGHSVARTVERGSDPSWARPLHAPANKRLSGEVLRALADQENGHPRWSRAEHHQALVVQGFAIGESTVGRGLARIRVKCPKCGLPDAHLWSGHGDCPCPVHQAARQRLQNSGRRHIANVDPNPRWFRDQTGRGWRRVPRKKVAPG